MHRVGQILIGSEALVSDCLTRYELRSQFVRLFPDVYVPADMPLTLELRSEAAWLWTRRRAVVAGLAAAKLHGVKWVRDSEPVELIWDNFRCPRGVITRAETLLDGEVKTVAGLPVTTASRAAFDLGRRGHLRTAVARVDGLMRFAGVTKSELIELAARHPHVKGLRQLDRVIRLADRGAESPRETYLRMLINDTAEFPPLVTQIPVLRPDGVSHFYLDMGWSDLKIAVEYDGDDHLSDPRQVADDILRLEYLHQQDWIVIRVIARDHRAEILRRIRQACELRLR